MIVHEVGKQSGHQGKAETADAGPDLIGRHPHQILAPTGDILVAGPGARHGDFPRHPLVEGRFDIDRRDRQKCRDDQCKLRPGRTRGVDELGQKCRDEDEALVVEDGGDDPLDEQIRPGNRRSIER